MECSNRPSGIPVGSQRKGPASFHLEDYEKLPAVTAEDVEEVRGAGWDDEAIYYSTTVCALFDFYNRWITATGVPEMSPEAHRLQGQNIARRGYVRDEKNR